MENKIEQLIKRKENNEKSNKDCNATRLDIKTSGMAVFLISPQNKAEKNKTKYKQKTKQMNKNDVLKSKSMIQNRKRNLRLFEKWTKQM